MGQAWFDDLTLRRWLDSDDHETLAHLFLELPAQRFASLGQTIGERWGHWVGPLAQRAAPVLARHAPELAWRCFAEPKGHGHRDAYAILGIVEALPLLPPETGRALLVAIAEETRATGRQSLDRDVVVGALIPVALQMDRPVVWGLIRKRLREADDERALDLVLSQVSTGLFGYSPYRKLASDLRQGRSKQSFQALAALSRADATLERLDQWSQGEAAIADLLDLVEALVAEVERQVIFDVVETLEAKGLDRHWERVTDFLIGSLAAACARPELDASLMGLQDLVALLSADLPPMPHLESLLARLETLEPGAVTVALIDALERERDSYGGVTIARVMGRLGWDAFVPTLTGSMNDDSGDLLCEEARDALVAIGGPARDHLMARWTELDGAQRIYGLSVLMAIGSGGHRGGAGGVLCPESRARPLPGGPGILVPARVRRPRPAPGRAAGARASAAAAQARRDLLPARPLARPGSRASAKSMPWPSRSRARTTRPESSTMTLTRPRRCSMS